MTTSDAAHALEWLADCFAMCRLAPDADLPAWATRGLFWSLSRSEEELSVIVAEQHVPPDLPPGMSLEGGWVALRVVGPLDFSEVGILARLTGALAEARVPVCAVSTFHSDLLFLKQVHAHQAQEVLSRDWTVNGTAPA